MKHPIFIVLIMFSCLFYGFAGWAKSIPRYKVLIIHSYHRGDKWSDDIGAGIKNELKRSVTNIDIVYEYMDSQRYPEKKNTSFLIRYYAYKYVANPPDIIVVTDESALKFIMNYRDVTFPNIPIVFCGIKYFNENLLYGEHGITGVVEKVNIGKTIKLAQKLNPRTKKLLIVVDNSDTSIATIKVAISWLKTNPQQLDVSFTPFSTMKRLKEKLSALPQNSAVLLVNFTMDKNRQLFSSDESAEIISQHSPVPVYTLWDNYLSQGILGGHLIRAEAQGSQTARLILKVLNSDSSKEFPVLYHSATQYLFDYNQLKRHRINLSLLPPQSIIVNQPFSVFEHYKNIIYGSIAGGFFLIFVIVVLSLNIVKRRYAEKKLKQYSKRLNLLYKVDEIILDSPGIEKMGQQVLDLVNATFDYDLLAIIIRDFEGILHIFTSNQDQRTVITQILRENSGADNEPRWPDDSSFHQIRDDLNIKITPIRFQKEDFGILIFGRTREKTFGQKLVKTNEDLACSMATALSNYQLFLQSKQHEQQLKELSAEILHAQEKERMHLSRELHDELGQTLTVVGLNLGLIKRKINKGNTTELLEYLQETESHIKKISTQVHDLSLDLRPPMLDELGLETTIRWYLKQFKHRTGLSVSLDIRGDLESELPSAITVTLYRILQETLNNIIKHTEAKNVTVLLHLKAGETELKINDDGKGFNSDQLQTTGIGIFGMRERLQSVGGNLTIDSHPGKGTTVLATISLGKKDESSKDTFSR